MNWYKKAQQNIGMEYQQLLEQAANIQITGTGQNETLSIGGQNIQARDLINHAKAHLAQTLVEHHVTEINTDPIQQANAQGLAISHEPGVVHVDIAKIFGQTKSSLSPTVQLDGTQIDQDAISQVAQFLEAEILETIGHESRHVLDYTGAFESNQPFTTVQEHPAEQFGQQMRQRYYNT